MHKVGVHIPSAATAAHNGKGYGGDELNAFFEGDYSSNAPRTSDELRRPSLLPAATAAAALASLHNHRAEYDWDSDPVRSRVAASLHLYSANTFAMVRMRRLRQTRRATDPAHDSRLAPSNSIYPPKNPTTRQRRYSANCYHRRSRNRRPDAPLRSHRVPDL